MNMPEQFQPTFESLTQYQCPDWFRDAKFGIWSHWGPQSVPMAGDWYARGMYIEGSDQYHHHCRVYGHPSQFGYKDLVKLWKAENFDPEGLMDLYYKAGARYFVAQAMHHDHFFNYPSQLNPMNAAQVGPMKDIVGLWQAAAAKYNLPFGLSEHLGATFAWWAVNKGCDKTGPYAGVPYDGSDPAYRQFYLDNAEHYREDHKLHMWYTQNTAHHDYWLQVMREIIDRYQPDLLYSDGSLPFGSHCDENKWEGQARPTTYPSDPAYRSGLEAAAYLYNASIARHGENRAVYNQKDSRPDVFHVGVLDIERGQHSEIQPDPWQTDTCIGGWFYKTKDAYKPPAHIIGMLVDIVSKNGTMLLNILQKPDGSIDEEARWILTELAAWFAVCAEGIYGTRPWKVAGEGPTGAGSGKAFDESEKQWQSGDVRFTQKDHTVYAFLMAPPENSVAVLRSFSQGERVKSVRLLGAGNIEFAHSFGVLTAQLPQSLPASYVNCLAIALE
jgi:alpha-L-fucosidase